MRSFNDLNSLFGEIEREANRTLKNEVASVARREMQRQIQDKVYDAYEPTLYERRGYDDGLIDSDNIEIEVVSDNTISVENIAYDGERNVPYIVESGEGYWFVAPDVLTRGRKFTEATADGLEQSRKHIDAMKEGLQRRGLDVR